MSEKEEMMIDEALELLKVSHPDLVGLFLDIVDRVDKNQKAVEKLYTGAKQQTGGMSEEELAKLLGALKKG